jgi:hypothetical protein
VVSASPAAASAEIVVLDDKNHVPGVADVPPPPRVAGEMISSQALPCVTSIGGFFAPD